MNEANELDLERYRNKRKRVKKMKSGIMGFLLIWVLISTIVMSFLVYKVYSLQKQMNSILNGTKTTSLIEKYHFSSPSTHIVRTFWSSNNCIFSISDIAIAFSTKIIQTDA